MKSILLIIVFVGLALCQTQNCDINGGCVEEGSKCTGDYYAHTIQSPFNIYSPDTFDQNLLMCGSGFYCRITNGEFGQCTEVADIGDTCDQDTVCVSGSYCYTPSPNSPSTCQWIPYLTLNQTCETSLQCVNGLICDSTEWICTPDRENFDVTTVCQLASHCLPTQYCDTTAADGDGACISQVDDNGVCNPSFANQCKPTSTCYPVNTDYKCTPLFSVAKDAVCTNSIPGGCDISQSLQCVAGTCQTITTSPASNNCSANGCENTEFCQCSDASNLSGVCQSFFFKTPAECKSSATTLFQCISSNGCASPFTGDNALAPDACAYSNCGSEYCDMVSNCQQSGTACNTDPLAGTICTSSSSSFLTVSVAMIFMGLLVILF
ncbi:disintegrin-like protein [Tieghemostelium lacteum]|uniref:Disintegrin-like protein n=1 Tax=Tieghemostelium lacteum TaxID=361077 RepID=A0A151Z6B9_TIELA|nr:disintegrin-like protein [Tieghemostelium lacteum]|eukprot:KYQ89500.1 disintegrin-like protein [Tieghemostelium lacteum]